MKSLARLSTHFTLAELTATAHRSIANTPSLEEVENLRHLANVVLEPVRMRFGPLYTTSGYRSPELNAMIGGSPSSSHMSGNAWDGVPLRDGVRWRDVFAFLKGSTLPVDQVIYEFGRWIHIGTRTGGHACRRQFLMIFSGGKYEPWNPDDPRVTR